MKKIFKVVVSSSLACGIMLNTLSFAAEVNTSLSLDQAIKVGIENSQMLELNKASMETQKIKLEQAKDGSKSYRQLKKAKDPFSTEYFDLNIRGVNEFLLEEEVAELGARYKMEEIDRQSKSIEKQLELGISKTYYGVLQTKDLWEIEKDNYKNIENNYKIVKKKFDLGSASKHDLNMMEIDLNNGKLEVEKAHDTYKETLRALNNLLDYPLDTDLSLTTGFVAKQMDINLDKDLDYAYANRFDYVESLNSLDLARKNFDATKSNYTPNTYMYRESDETLKMAELSSKMIRNSIEADVKSKYDQLTTSKIQIELMDSNIKKAEEGVRVLRVQYDLNMVTMDRVNEALVGLNKAKLGKANAIGQYNTALIDYELAVKVGNLG